MLLILSSKLEELIKSEFMQNIYGHPIIGDTLYGSPSPFISRQALHAYKVKFIHPITRKKMEIIAEIPNDLKGLIT